MVKTSGWLRLGVFHHAAWAVGCYSGGPETAGTVRTKSTGGFNHPDGSPCTSHPSLISPRFTRLVARALSQLQKVVRMHTPTLPYPITQGEWQGQSNRSSYVVLIWAKKVSWVWKIKPVDFYERAPTGRASQWLIPAKSEGWRRGIGDWISRKFCEVSNMPGTQWNKGYWVHWVQIWWQKWPPRLFGGHTISEATKIAIINSMHMELRAIRVTKYNFEIRSDLWGYLEVTRASEVTKIAIRNNMHIDISAIYD